MKQTFVCAAVLAAVAGAAPFLCLALPRSPASVPAAVSATAETAAPSQPEPAATSAPEAPLLTDAREPDRKSVV